MRGSVRGTVPRGRGGKPFEVNPWFNYYVTRDGRNAALREAIAVGRSTMTEPCGRCTCGQPLWFRPLVGAHTCYACQPGRQFTH